MNTVFQDYALFPHMNVQQNVEYGLLVKKVPKAERRQRALARRWSRSAWPTRRTADPASSPAASGSGWPSLARWSTGPRSCCSTSPSAHSTSSCASRCRSSSRQIQREVGITFLFVTHDQDEALTISDRIAVFNEGRIEQVGTARGDLRAAGTNAFVAGFVGTSNLLEAAEAERATGRRGTFGIRPEKLTRRAPQAAARPTAWRDAGGTLAEVVYAGAVTRFVVDLDGGGRLVALRGERPPRHPRTAAPRATPWSCAGTREHLIEVHPHDSDNPSTAQRSSS